MTIVSFAAARVLLMGGSPPFFNKLQNPAAHSDDVTTRMLTFNYLASLHAWLLVLPYNLCYDWSAGSIPLLKEISDPRVAAIAALYITLGMH